LFDPKEEGDR
jgi:GTP:adenosylcobinamide-phosphate guanylyltransferase